MFAASEGHNNSLLIFCSFSDFHCSFAKLSRMTHNLQKWLQCLPKMTEMVSFGIAIVRHMVFIYTIKCIVMWHY